MYWPWGQSLLESLRRAFPAPGADHLPSPGRLKEEWADRSNQKAFLIIAEWLLSIQTEMPRYLIFHANLSRSALKP